MAAVDALVERGIVDPDRLGFTGYSYGGLMTNVVVSRTDRFAAAVSIAGIWNYTSAMGQNNPQLFIDSYRQPWAGTCSCCGSTGRPRGRPDLDADPDHARPGGPAGRSAAVGRDVHLPAAERRPQPAGALPREGHGINEPNHMLDYQTRELEWFRHYLLGDDDAEGAQEPVPVEATAAAEGGESRPELGIRNSKFKIQESV